ncbi:MAG: radical SAM protein [Desulforhopalus sp.]
MEQIQALLIRVRPSVHFSIEPAEDEQLGLLYIATYCRSKGYLVSVLDEPTITLSIVEEALNKSDADVIGFYCDHENAMTLMSMINSLKTRHPQKLIVVGGPQVSAEPWDERMLTSCPADITVRGEGEFTFLEILNWKFKEKGTLKTIQGISFISDDGTIFRTPSRGNKIDLDVYPIPDRNLNYYGKTPNGSENILTSRGCPFRCAFCFEGRDLGCRKRSVSSILDEVEMLLRDRDMHYLAILDDVFTLSASRVKEVCEGFKRLQDKYHRFAWFCEGRAEILRRNPEAIHIMKDAGLVRLQIGVETGSQKVLDAYGKGITLDDVRECVDICYESDLLSVVGNFIIGGAHESEQTLKESIDFACELMDRAPGCYDFNTTIYTPYPGTRMYRDPATYGMRIIDGDCVTGPGDNYAFVETEELNKWQILNARHVFMEAVEAHALSLLPQVSEERRKRHFHTFYTIRMSTIWVQLMSAQSNLYNYYGLQVSGGKKTVPEVPDENIESYKPVRTIPIGGSSDGLLVASYTNPPIRFNKLGSIIYEYCYGKLTVGEIVDRLGSELDSKRDTVRDYVVETLRQLDERKLVLLSEV